MRDPRTAAGVLEHRGLHTSVSKVGLQTLSPEVKGTPGCTVPGKRNLRHNMVCILFLLTHAFWDCQRSVQRTVFTAVILYPRPSALAGSAAPPAGAGEGSTVVG